MHSNASTDIAETYTSWLGNGGCLARRDDAGRDAGAVDVFAAGTLKKGGALYIESVPEANRARARWGWKHPKSMVGALSMLTARFPQVSCSNEVFVLIRGILYISLSHACSQYHLDKLLKLFPGLIFVHVLRDPRDIAAVPWEHAKNRASSFAALHGGYDRAANWLKEEACPRAFGPRAGGDAERACAIPAAALEAVDKCGDGSAHGTAFCAKAAGVPKKAPWRCLNMMLWYQWTDSSNLFFRFRQITHSFSHFFLLRKGGNKHRGSFLWDSVPCRREAVL